MTTEAFEGLARQEAQRQGLPDARIASVTHPVGGISEAELDQRASAVVDSLIELFAD